MCEIEPNCEEDAGMGMTIGKFIVSAIAIVIVSLFFSAAYVGGKRQDAMVRVSELLVEAGRFRAKEVKDWAVLCQGYFIWRERQKYSGDDLMGGNCNFLGESYPKEAN